MKRIGCLIAVCLATAVPAAAQTPAVAPPTAPKDTLVVGQWIRKTRVGLGLTQSSLSRNWTGDEIGSLSWLFTGDFLSDGQWKPTVRLVNTLYLAFGQTHQQAESREGWLAPQKSADRIDYDGVARFTLGRWVDPYFALTFDSQFYDRFDGQRRYINPILVTEAAGIARPWWDRPSRSLVSRLGFALRQGYDHFAAPPLDKTTHDGGIEFRTVGRFATAGDRTVFRTELALFQALFFSGADAERLVFGADRWKTLDVYWQNLLSNKINKWMSLDLYFEYLFDEQLDKAGQFKQTLGVGFTVDL
jgi:hypothetical protein